MENLQVRVLRCAFKMTTTQYFEYSYIQLNIEIYSERSMLKSDVCTIQIYT